MKKFYPPSGYIPEKFSQEDAVYDMVFGARKFTGVVMDWRPYVPAYEPQGPLPFCVSFSRLNCAETLAKKEGFTLNLSDRYLAVRSGTSRVGNSLNTVSEYFRTQGTVEEMYCPLTEEMRDKGMAGWDETCTIPASTDALPKFKGGNHSWVFGGQDVMKSALAFSPLQIAVGIGDTWWNAVATPPETITAWHAVMLIHIDAQNRYHIYDSLTASYKIMSADYPVPYCKSFRDLPSDWKSVQRRMMPAPQTQPTPVSLDQYIPAENDSNIAIKIANVTTLHTLMAAGHLPGTADPTLVVKRPTLIIYSEE